MGTREPKGKGKPGKIKTVDEVVKILQYSSTKKI